MASDAPCPGFPRSTMALLPAMVQVTLQDTTLGMSPVWTPQIQFVTKSWVFCLLNTPRTTHFPPCPRPPPTFLTGNVEADRCFSDPAPLPPGLFCR